MVGEVTAATSQAGGTVMPFRARPLFPGNEQPTIDRVVARPVTFTYLRSGTVPSNYRRFYTSLGSGLIQTSLLGADRPLTHLVVTVSPSLLTHSTLEAAKRVVEHHAAVLSVRPTFITPSDLPTLVVGADPLQFPAHWGTWDTLPSYRPQDHRRLIDQGLINRATLTLEDGAIAIYLRDDGCWRLMGFKGRPKVRRLKATFLPDILTTLLPADAYIYDN